MWSTMIINTNRYRYRYSLSEMYDAIRRVYRAGSVLAANRKDQKISQEFVERIMLAVTEVNGCSVCSYAHTKMALESGFSEEEIDSFLSGSNAYIVPEEAKAILFAQSFADAHGQLDEASYQALVEEYGEARSEVVLASAQVMTLGNILGLPLSGFWSRLKGKPYENSSVSYELLMIVAPVVLFPVSALEMVFRKIGLM